MRVCHTAAPLRRLWLHACGGLESLGSRGHLVARTCVSPRLILQMGQNWAEMEPAVEGPIMHNAGKTT